MHSGVVVAGEGCGAVGEGLVVATSGVPGTFQVPSNSFVVVYVVYLVIYDSG